MKLDYWRIPKLSKWQGFFVTSVTDDAGGLRFDLVNVANEADSFSILFRNHFGLLVSDEFGMEGFDPDTPAKKGGEGSNFFIGESTAFKEFCQKGFLGRTEWSKIKSYVIIDTDHYREVLSDAPPEIFFPQAVVTH
jgi:hypothetical protein